MIGLLAECHEDMNQRHKKCWQQWPVIMFSSIRPVPCIHTFFPFVLKYYRSDINRNKYTYISDPWSGCKVWNHVIGPNLRSRNFWDLGLGHPYSLPTAHTTHTICVLSSWYVVAYYNRETSFAWEKAAGSETEDCWKNSLGDPPERRGWDTGCFNWPMSGQVPQQKGKERAGQHIGVLLVISTFDNGNAKIPEMNWPVRCLMQSINNMYSITDWWSDSVTKFIL